MHEFKVGDVLRVKQLEDMPSNTLFGFPEGMNYLCGERFTVRRIEDDCAFFSEERIEGTWNISYDMLEYDDENDSGSINPNDFLNIISS